jgi:hypothetical protein
MVHGSIYTLAGCEGLAAPLSIPKRETFGQERSYRADHHAVKWTAAHHEGHKAAEMMHVVKTGRDWDS